jgi:fumarate reductase (CoM/CoB) subunit A
MWDYVGIVRNEKNLNLMLKELKHLEKRIECSEKNKLNIPFLELRNMILVSNLITKAAFIRRESRGAHYREDYPRTDDKNWLKHISFEGKGKEVNTSIQPII